VPATVLGFGMMFILKNGAQVGLYVGAGISVQIPFTLRTLILGLVMGIFVPLISNILPIKAALGTSLRNALDRFRPSVDEMEVQMVRMESMGISLNQIVISITLLSVSVVTFYFFPYSILQGSMGLFNFISNQLLIMNIIGLIFLG